MKLSRVIPAHTKTVHFTWVDKEYTRYTEKFRQIRARCGSPLDTCFWCKHKFEDGEMMGVAARPKAGNVMLCQGCATEARKDTPCAT